jgi:heptosyltransferase I
VGFGRDRARDAVWLAANRHLPPRPRRHTLEMFLEFLDYLGIADSRLAFRLSLTEEERQAQEEFFAPLRDRPVVAMVPGSANANKDRLPERYAQVVDALEHEFGLRPILVGGPGEREARLAREIVERSRTPLVWALGDGVRRLLWLIGGSDLVIAPDTGPVHIARAREVPVIGLYGHTNPWRVGPYRKFQDLWVDRYTDTDELPDPSRFDPKHGRMEQITVEDVLARVGRAVERYLRPPRERNADSG